MKLLQHVQTYENLQVLMTELDSVNLSLSGDTAGDLVSLVEKKSPSFAKLFVHHLEDKDIKNKKDAIASLSKLAEELEGVEVVELTVAFNPNEKSTDKIFDWLKENVSDNTVLDYKKNPSIMSGALVSYKGKYGDFSGSRALKKAFIGLRKELKV